MGDTIDTGLGSVDGMNWGNSAGTPLVAVVNIDSESKRPYCGLSGNSVVVGACEAGEVSSVITSLFSFSFFA